MADGTPRAISVDVDDHEIHVVLVDGRRLSVPLAWFPRLRAANAEQRSMWRLIGNGEGIHWPDVDEDLSVKGLFRDNAAPSATPPPSSG